MADSDVNARDLSAEEYRAAEEAMLRAAARPGPAFVPPEGFDARTASRAEFDRVSREYVRHETRRAVAGIPGRMGPR